VLERLGMLAEALRPRSALEITELRFCSRISRWGDYDDLPPDHAFRAGADGRPGDYVQVYVELRNLTSQKKGDFHETRLASSLKIFAAGDPARQHPVCRLGMETQVDRSRHSPRQDWFLSCHFYIPP